MEELNLRPDELKNVRMAAFLDKYSRAFPHMWRQRYCVLSGNFFFIYHSPRDEKPKRVVCIDDAEALVRVLRAAQRVEQGGVCRSSALGREGCVRAE